MLGPDHDLGDIESPLHAAARAGNLQIVEYLVHTLQVDVTMHRRYWNNPIHAAVEGRNIEVVQLLLSHPQVDAGAMTAGEQTALHIAIEGGNLEIVELLLAREDVDPTSGYAELGLLTDLRPFHLAALHGDIKILQALMAHPKISVGMKDGFGRTALHYAALGVAENLIKSDDVFHFLLEQPGISLMDEDSDGFNVLHFLSVPCHNQSEEDFHVARSLMNLCIAKGVPVDKTSPWGTAFHIAVHGSLGILRNAAHLLSCGADPSIIPTPFVSVTPLHHCLAHAAPPRLENEQLQVLFALIEAGVDLEQFSDYEDELNPLEVPAWEFDTSIPPIQGSALAYAVLCARSVKCAEVLLEAGADVTRLAYAGTPFRETHEFHLEDDAASLVGFLLRTVCPGGHFKDELLTDWVKEMLKLLLRYGAQIDDAISFRWCPIWIAVDAAVQDEFGLLNFLLENSTNSNCQKHFLKQVVRSAKLDAKPSVTALVQALQDFLRKFWPDWEEESEGESVGHELSPGFGSDGWDFEDDMYQHVGGIMLQWMADHGPLAADEAIWDDDSMSDDLDLEDDMELEEDDLDLEEDLAVES
ncbi:ankyrin repeats (3 copies) domain-containing protein [Pochonia chlamydosporia 170]|uniref:Ankyrin repeats (3 copies) domain-containing protein n=1 Tax=Pochonia chlamydosporia 170 TaxID=1380566 RepID=A0A179FKF3_METCM|nr:ankyrin repeats (3 copies) domain-containing protein [Pochonia chlamydosporia 170]OAQ66034.1 ankyrin repeats (3 copies) domain-containing protein [Pochonia chlamydosporia 170]